jgi:hypothetical protein
MYQERIDPFLGSAGKPANGDYPAGTSWRPT